MSENTERELRNAWQKLDEAFSMPGAMQLKKPTDVQHFKKLPKSLGAASPSGKIGTIPKGLERLTPQQIAQLQAHDAAGKSGEDTLVGEGAGQDAVYMYISDAIQELMSEYPQHAEQIKSLEPKLMDDAATMGGEGMRIDYDFVYNSTKEAIIDAGIDLDAPPMPAQPGASASMFEDRNKIESIYEFGGQILDSAEAQGLSLDETQIDAANQKIISALQGEGMRNPHNLEAIIDDAVADAAYQGGDHADGVGGGIMESIHRSFELIKMIQENKGPCWKGYQQIGMKDKNGKEVPNCVPVKEKASAWQRKEGKNEEGGLNAKGRASAKKDGHNLKSPVSAKQAKKSPKSAARRKSFCARMKGMKSKMTGSEKKNDPDSRINKSLRKWDC